MDSQKKPVLDCLQQANNILVSVSANPTVDQLAAAIGFTLLLNKLGKHATAVFSGEVPSTLEFLEPEKTLEKNTDSLRDFIIALDKSKADKLRYKVEENVVKIFITPYRTSLSDKDLEFSQGDFNVDAVIALGVKEQAELDMAITAHGRILHDATVISINNDQGGELGSIHWQDQAASSLCEMIVSLGNDLGKDLFDSQIATALLTGIVAATNRFSNDKTTPATMTISSQLMAAGANQQLVATKLEEPAPEPEPAPQPVPEPVAPSDDVIAPASPTIEPPVTPAPPEPPAPPAPTQAEDGMLAIEHPSADGESDKTDETPETELTQIHVDEEGTLRTVSDANKPVSDPGVSSDTTSSTGEKTSLITTPPTLGGTLTANSRPDDLPEPSADALSLPSVDTPFLSHDAGSGIPASTPAPPPAPPLFSSTETLSQLESEVRGTQSAPNGAPSQPPVMLDSARDAVQAAIASDPTLGNQPLPPIAALNAQPVFDDLHPASQAPTRDQPLTTESTIPPVPQPKEPNSDPPRDEPLDTLNMPLPPASFALPPAPPSILPSQSENNPPASPPPPVPPPMFPPSDPV